MDVAWSPFGMSRAWRLALTACGVLGASLSLVACGGKSRGSDAAAETQGGSTSAAGGTTGAGQATAGGAAALAGTAGAAPTVGLDDVFPWFDAAGNVRVPIAENNEVLHLESTGTPARASTSTHNVVDMLSWAHFVRFSARASSPTHLLVSAGHEQFSYDYFAARESDKPWPSTGVDVGVEWQEFSVAIADMQPPSMPTDSWPSFFLGFSVEHPEPVEVWIDSVQFFPAE